MYNETMDIMNVIVMLYCVGVACYAVHAFYLLHRVYQGEQIFITVRKIGTILMFNLGLKGYLLVKMVCWPYFLFVQTNPLTLISETFFKSYGAQGVTYCGRRGLNNFFNDVFRGKQRYKDYDIKFFNMRCIHEGKVYKEYLTYVSEPQDIVYAKVIIAKHTKKPNRYLFVQAIHFENTTETVKDVTRYDLDRGDKVTRRVLETRLRDIDPNAVAMGLEGWGDKN